MANALLIVAGLLVVLLGLKVFTSRLRRGAAKKGWETRRKRAAEKTKVESEKSKKTVTRDDEETGDQLTVIDTEKESNTQERAHEAVEAKAAKMRATETPDTTSETRSRSRKHPLMDYDEWDSIAR